MNMILEDSFKRRLVELRLRKNVSARDMSLSIGQNPGYINWQGTTFLNRLLLHLRIPEHLPAGFLRRIHRLPAAAQ